MNKTCTFRAPTDDKVNILVYTFHLKLLLSNERTSIYENEYMRLCIDKKVIRVLIFDKNNTLLIEKLRTYFYGDEYNNI